MDQAALKSLAYKFSYVCPYMDVDDWNQEIAILQMKHSDKVDGAQYMAIKRDVQDIARRVGNVKRNGGQRFDLVDSENIPETGYDPSDKLYRRIDIENFYLRQVKEVLH